MAARRERSIRIASTVSAVQSVGATDAGGVPWSGTTAITRMPAW
jgi:hypothetical protein